MGVGSAGAKGEAPNGEKPGGCGAASCAAGAGAPNGDGAGPDGAVGCAAKGEAGAASMLAGAAKGEAGGWAAVGAVGAPKGEGTRSTPPKIARGFWSTGKLGADDAAAKGEAPKGDDANCGGSGVVGGAAGA